MIETERGNHVATRNQRLAALHTFYRYLAVHHLEMLAEAERVEAIPSKRCPASKAIFLEREDIDSIFKVLPKNGAHARRDRALLVIPYNIGARVQEVADLRHRGQLRCSSPLLCSTRADACCSVSCWWERSNCGGRCRARTCDLLLVRQAL